MNNYIKNYIFSIPKYFQEIKYMNEEEVMKYLISTKV